MRSANLLIRGLSLALLLSIIASLTMAGCSKGNNKVAVPGEEWSDDLRSRIDRHIDDPQKRDRLMHLVGQDVDLFETLAQETATYEKRVRALDRDYHSTPDDFRGAITAYNQIRYRLRNQSIEIRFNMKSICTPEEWHHISRFRTKKGLLYQLTRTPGTG